MSGKDKMPVELCGQQSTFDTRSQQESLRRNRRQRRGAHRLLRGLIFRTDPAIELRQLFGKTALFLLIQTELQRAGRERQTAVRFSDAQIHASGSRGSQRLKFSATLYGL